MKALNFCAFAIGLSIAIGQCSKGKDAGTDLSSAAEKPTLQINPTSGPVGTIVTLTASRTLDFPGVTSVQIGSTPAILVSTDATSARIFVMPGSTGTVTATNTSGSFTSTSSFSLTASGVVANQQGAKLVGTGNTGAALQGHSVSLSADGNTVIVGGRQDNSNQGAAWVYTRTGTVWSQEGSKLVGTGNSGTARKGWSVCLSADGNTALLGGPLDNANQGAVWVFTRSGTTWSQQGSKLVGTGNTGAAQIGISLSLSADGNTALVGGYADDSSQGAAWVFTRSGTTWSQQGSKLVGTGNVGAGQQGFSVALSADGNTALVGGYDDNASQGAVWVFARSGTTWSQQGSKLVGTGNTGAACQGRSVSLSADGNTALVGANCDNSGQGAAWVFTRSGSTWSQQGSKMVGTGNVGAAQQGSTTSLSADGNIALLGGYVDNTQQGAAWVFTRSGTTWSQQGSKLVGTGNSGAARQAWSVSLAANGDTGVVGGTNDNSNQGAAWVFVP